MTWEHKMTLDLFTNKMEYYVYVFEIEQHRHSRQRRYRRSYLGLKSHDSSINAILKIIKKCFTVSMSVKPF